jgi:outer membrane protein OmpA-like peptidoglycan-associated protein
VPRELPKPPFVAQDFNIVFDYGNDFLVYQYAEMIVEKMSLFAKASNASSVTITGYAATVPTEVSGRKFSEPLALAKTRAERVAEALSRLGVDRKKMKIDWRGDPEAIAGLPTPGAESSKRRASIRIVPASQ